MCAAVAVVGVVFGCGKRGDPLPPLRPFPDAAEALTVRQNGNRIRVEWRAPMRNADGTTEKLELAEVEVRRRVIDLAALVEEQTKTIVAASEEEAVDEEMETGAAEEPESESAAEPPPSAAQPASEQTPAQPSEAGDTARAESVASEPEDAGESTSAPPVPVLDIPNFAPQSRYVTTLESTVPGETVTFEEAVDPEWIGKRVEYAVVYINRSERRGQRTPVVQLDPVPPLPAPGRPEAEAGDGFVKIRWSHAGTSPDAPAFFSVFRRPGSAKAYPDRPVNDRPIRQTELVDASVAFDVPSCYVVKTVLVPEPEVEPEAGVEPEAETEVERDPALGPEPEPEPDPEPDPEREVEPESEGATKAERSAQAVPETESGSEEPRVIVPTVPPLKNPVRIESEASPETCLTPVDTFPPPSPTGVVAVRSGESVLITWNALDRADIAGYRVYRAESPSGPFRLLNEELLRVPSYSDDAIVAGTTYYYAVTAIDDAPVANEGVRSEASEVTIAPR